MNKVAGSIAEVIKDSVVEGFGPNKNGLCLLRVIKNRDTHIFVLTHSTDRPAPSVTDYVNEIAEVACDGVFQPPSKRKLREAIIHSFWVEHWPKEIPIFGGSYAVISFDDRLNPTWSYASKEDIASSLGIDASII